MLQVGAESDKEDIFHGAGCPLGFRSLRLHLTAEERLTMKPKQNVVHCNSTMLIARHTCVCQRAPACSAKGTLSPSSAAESGETPPSSPGTRGPGRPLLPHQ